MKTFIRLVLGSLATVATSHAFAAPQSYPLICRGGPSMSFSYTSSSRLVQMLFTRGSQPASSGVPASYCTWSDRGIGPNEPNKICHRGVDLGIAWYGNGQVTQLNASQAPYLSPLRTSANTFIFQVYNNGQGCFEVTRLGP